MPSVLTNRGLATITGAAISAATDIRQGVVTDAGTAPTTAAIRDMNFVADLLAVTTEAAVAGYARADLASVTVTEDDTANTVTITAAAPTYGPVAAGETWESAFYYIEAGSDAARVLLQVDTPAATQVTNGGTVTGPALLITVSNP